MISIDSLCLLFTSPEVKTRYETTFLLPALNSLMIFLTPFVCVADIRICTFLDANTPITPTKNSLSTVSVPILCLSPYICQWVLRPCLRKIFPSDQCCSQKDLRIVYGAVVGDKIVEVKCSVLELWGNNVGMLYVLSYLGMSCLPIAISRHHEHVVPSHNYYCTVSYPKAVDQHSRIWSVLSRQALTCHMGYTYTCSLRHLWT